MDESELVNKNNDVQARRLSLIDVSSEDDSLINSYGGDLRFSISDDQENRNFQLFEAMVANKLEDVPEDHELSEQVTQPSESLEPEMAKRSGKYNLRKSLAWDTAFFTSTGVLDPEELSSMMEGEKSGKQMLPGIQEEIHKSTDSISTLESDTLTLESIDANLFEDVRASIQKSSKASGVVDEGMKEGLGVTETKISGSSKGLDCASQDKVMPRLASKKPSINVQKPGKLKKVALCPQVSQSVSARGESTASLLKRTKVLGKPNPSPTALTKRASLGGSLIKMEKDNVKSATGRGASLPKIPLSSRLVPRPGPLSRSTSLGSSPTAKREVASSFDSSGSTSSNNIGKSPFNSKRKAGSRTDNPPSSGSTCKTPSRIEPRNKSQSGKSHLSTNMVSGTKLLTSTSPASSVSEWSSDSSSSISTLKRVPYSPRASLDIRSSKSSSVDGDLPDILDLQNHVYDQTAGHETRVKAAAAKNGALPSASKPSGLRLPSPKIGFFDGVKSAVSSPNGSMHPHPVVPSGLPKSGARSGSLAGDQNKAKLGKLQPARTVAKLGNKKPDAQKTSSDTKPKSPIPLQQASTAAKKVFSPSRNSISPRVPSKGPCKSGRENQLRHEIVGTEGHGIDIDGQENCVVELNDSPPLSKDKVSPELKVHPHVKAAKVTPIDGGSPTDSTSTCNANNIFPSEKVTEDATYKQRNLKQTEISHIEDEVDGLSRQVGAMDINAETQKMLVADSLPSTQFQQ